MRSIIIVGLTCASLLVPEFQKAFASTDEGAFMETLICGTGVTIRIPIGEENEDEAPAHIQACHALCSRGADEEGSSESGNG